MPIVPTKVCNEYAFANTNIRACARSHIRFQPRIFALKTSTNTREYRTYIHAPIGLESLKYTIFTTYMSNIHCVQHWVFELGVWNRNWFLYFKNFPRINHLRHLSIYGGVGSFWNTRTNSDSKHQVQIPSVARSVVICLCLSILTRRCVTWQSLRILSLLVNVRLDLVNM